MIGLRLIVVVVMALALQGQMLQAVRTELRGPAHVHTEHAETATSKLALILPRDFVAAEEKHFHDSLQRHFHADAVTDELIVEGASDTSVPLAGKSTAGYFGAALMAILPALPTIAVLDGQSTFGLADPGVLQTRYPPLLDRPPIA